MGRSAKGSSKTILVTVPYELFERVCMYAEHENMSRSGLCCLAIKSYLDSAETMPSAIRLMDSFSKLMSEFVDRKADKATLERGLSNVESEMQSIQEKLS